jgi:hypothetical protein
LIFDRSLIEAHLPQLSLTEVAHYTRIGTLCHFLEGSKGWTSARATPVQFLNDRQELAIGLEVLGRIAERAPKSSRRVTDIISSLSSTFGDQRTDAYQMSFSGNPDELGQWRGYGSNGMGCSVATDTRDLHSLAHLSGWIIYKPQKQEAFARKVLKALRKEVDNDLITQVVVAAACFMKHEGFSPEMEYRVLFFPDPHDVRFRESGDRLVPFIDFLKSYSKTLPVRGVTIGPGWQLANMPSELLSKHHVPQGIKRILEQAAVSVDPQSSKIPYDPR